MAARPDPAGGSDPVAGPEDADTVDALLADALLSIGGRAVLLTDVGWTTYLPESAPLPDDPADLAAEIQQQTGLDDVSVEYAWQDHAEWVELWKVGLEPRRVTDRLVVTPSWCTPDLRPGDLVLELDPGMAFGNAEHGTTRGCLRLLDGTVRTGDRLLDIGAGSAVLSIAAALLGAGHCLAVEGDELAIETARANASRNGVAERVEVVHAHVDAPAIAAMGPVDGVMCNIEGHLLTPLLPGLEAAVASGGWLLLSGLLEDQWEGFSSSVTGDGFRLVDADADGEWRAGLFRRKGES